MGLFHQGIKEDRDSGSWESPQPSRRELSHRVRVRSRSSSCGPVSSCGTPGSGPRPLPKAGIMDAVNGWKLRPEQVTPMCYTSHQCAGIWRENGIWRWSGQLFPSQADCTGLGAGGVKGRATGTWGPQFVLPPRTPGPSLSADPGTAQASPSRAVGHGCLST